MIRAASVGLGWWSNELARSVQGRSEIIQVASCYSRSSEKREAFAREFGTGTHASYETLLADETIDAVILTTPHSLHAEHVVTAARAGKHVFVEKPFTLTYDSALEAIQACRDAPVTLAVGHNRRFTASGGRLKKMQEAGDFGTLLHLEANFSAASATSYTSEWWRASRTESPAGGIAGLGIHLIDLMCWIAGPIVAVTAQAKRRVLAVDVDDTTSVLFEFESGVTGYLGCMFAAPYTSLLNVYGTRMNAFAGIDSESVVVKTIDGQSSTMEMDRVDTLKTELEEFALSCLGHKMFRVSPAQAASNVAVMEAIAQSAVQRRPVQVQAGREGIGQLKSGRRQ